MWWCVGFVVVTLCAAKPILNPLSWLPLPNKNNQLRPFSGTADRAAWDDRDNYLYVIGGVAETLHVIDVMNHSNPTIVHTQVFDPILDGIPKAIAFCRGPMKTELVIAFSARSRLNPAYVETFKPYFRNDPFLVLYGRTLLDGSDPSQVKFDKNCFHFAVTSEGLPGLRGQVMEDPTPHLDVFSHLPNGWHRVTTNFQTVTNMERARYIYKGENLAHHSHIYDMEPTDLFIGEDNAIYVNFYKNNAIVKLTLNNLNEPGQLYSYGVKNWQDSDIDTSDRDTAVSPARDNINMVRRNIRSFYQPKAMHALTFNNKTYVITANTGGMKTYTATVEGIDFTDASRARPIDDSLFSPTLDPTTMSHLNDDAQLGRLFVSTNRDVTDGWNHIFQFFDHAYAFGGRSWSIWDSETFVQHYDSGDGLEYESSQYSKPVFNGDCYSAGLSPPQHLDTRSDDMGSEPSSIATGTFQGAPVVVIGSGRMGGLWVYTVSESEGKPRGNFQSYFRLGELNGNWQALYDNQIAGVQYINDLLIVNHNGMQMVIAVGSQLGAVAFFELVDGNFP